MGSQINRVFQIIEYIASNGPSEIDEIYDNTGIPRSTIFKLLSNLKSLGYIIQTKSAGQTHYWCLTLKLLKISKLILARIDFKDEIRSVLVKLSKDTNEVVQLGVLHNKKIMYIDIIKTPKSIISHAGIGSEMEINISAAGMVLASALEEDELKDLLKSESFPKNTIYTVTEPMEIRKELKKVASDGYAFDDQRYAIGVRCIAAPVYNFEGKVIGAINITGHISTISNENIDFLKKELIKAASEASKIMGFES
jgi:IclR family transcriptional regulator, KDG regulon repressor